MATFKAEVFQNQFLPQGAKEVHAIMTVTSEGASGPGPAPSGGKMFGLICDISGSMDGEKIHAAKDAMVQLVNLIPADVHFFIVTGSDVAKVVFPASIADDGNKQRAIAAIRAIRADGATLMSTWIERALEQFNRMPNAVRQALLLTDGLNDEGDGMRLNMALESAKGVFQCDCRGIGTDWNVQQLRAISGRLLGSTDIIAHPSQIGEDFRNVLATAIGKTVSDVVLRVWTPVGARIVFCKQVSPDIVDLTGMGKSPKAQVFEYPTGAWSGSESRDYHVTIEVKPGNVGDEMLAGRVSLIVRESGNENKVAEARVLAVWTDDEGKSTRIERHVAHYTGQAELAQSIQEGLAARERGDEEAATALLGKAVKIAHESGNEGTAKLLRTVVDVQDAVHGTVRLKRSVSKEDEMALESRSTKTKRIQKP